MTIPDETNESGDHAHGLEQEVPNMGMESKPILGQLSEINPRDVWAHEAQDFTPWLRENAEVLAHALGVDLEIREAEVPVGGFNVDLVGEDITNGRRLIVENQLEPTDHSHLGQLLTYAGGLEAATIVWISPTFRDEHRQALDWLNAHTVPDVAFFGLELEVVRIGESLPAPNLKPASVPNDWSREVKQAGSQSEPSDLARDRQRFFREALAALKARKPGLTNATRVGLDNWFTVPSGRTGPYFAWVFTGNRQLRVELYIDFGDGDKNVEALRKLAVDREAVERAIGSALAWDELEGRRACRIHLDRPLTEGLLPTEEPDMVEWAVDTMLAFNEVFRPLVKSL